MAGSPYEHNLRIGYQHQRAGRAAEAEAIYRQVLREDPHDAEALHLMGMLARDRGRLDEAAAYMGRSIAIKPERNVFHSNLAEVLCAMGMIEESIESCMQAIALGPHPAAYINLGNAKLALLDFEGAEAALERAVTLDPNDALAHSNLALALVRLDRIGEAIEHCDRAIAIAPNLVQAHNNRGLALATRGAVAESLAGYRRAVELEPRIDGPHSNLLFTMHYDPAASAEAIFGEHLSWARRHAPTSLAQHAHANLRDPGRPLRVGYVSHDLRGHPVGRFLLPLLVRGDRSAVESFGYADVAKPDAVTEKLKSACAGWRFTERLDDEALAKQIIEDRIDILVDLSGHTAGNRLRVFARKPAPVQVTFLGYPDTTGMTAIDYRLTDRLADPPADAQGRCVERLEYLPGCAWCFVAPEDAPEVSPPPVLRNGIVTFGSFNSLPKLSDPTLDAWAAILSEVKKSRLLIKSPALGDAGTRQLLLARLASRGIDSGRVELVGKRPTHIDHLAAYGQVDIALDSFPYHGTTTTCDALWMGVPVITLAGQTHVSRTGVSLLTHANLPELIADSWIEYVAKAIARADDSPRLLEMRASMRERLRASALMDESGYTRGIEEAYRAMWERWRQSR